MFNKMGFLPCFSRYRFKEYPPINFYQRDSYLQKVKNLVSAFLSSSDPLSLKESIGGHDVQTIRPDSAESKRIIASCGSPECAIYRIDYGNSPFKIVFGLANEKRCAYVFIVDTTHNTYSGKNR